MAEVKKAVKTTKATLKSKVNVFLGTGRRKRAVARVRLIPGGNGTIIINKQHIDEYFKQDILKKIVSQPLVLTGNETKYDIAVNVVGGGLTGQAGAICHGISRALDKAEGNLHTELKKAGFLTRDSRMKERKKYGRKRARKAPQFSKR
jgi:small subunit ribosomal protein S9